MDEISCKLAELKFTAPIKKGKITKKLIKEQTRLKRAKERENYLFYLFTKYCKHEFIIYLFYLLNYLYCLFTNNCKN